MPCVLTPCYKLIKGPILARGFFSRVTTAEGSGSSLCCLQWGPQGMARVFKGEDDDHKNELLGTCWILRDIHITHTYMYII
jgi:hypothetical protein